MILLAYNADSICGRHSLMYSAWCRTRVALSKRGPWLWAGLLSLRSLIVAASTIKQGGWFNLKIAGQVPGYGNALRIDVRKDQVALRDRLDAAVASSTPAERRGVVDQHTRLNVTTAIDPRPLWLLGGALALVLATSGFWIVRLRRANRALDRASHTDALTGLHNRTEFEPHYQRELSRCRRLGQSLSVILLDIDFFRRVNDQLGHPVGDRVLVDVAALLQRTARQGDWLLRWGGEEFLLVCADTNRAQAQALAQRIVDAARAHDFGLPWPLTLSAGVATLAPEDEAGHPFEQVDGALYRAKQSGRDRVVVHGQPASTAPAPAAP